jgi:glutathione S-transferase
MLELLQFRHSPYNEKVRWALDFKRVPHARRSLLPGPHLPTVKKLTGRSTTPVLVADGEAIDGSARILAWLEERYPQPPLWPDAPADRAEALRIEQWFDDDLTPRIRRPVLQALLANPAYFAALFAQGATAAKRLAYACTVPLAAPLVRRGNGIGGPATLQDGLDAALQALDFVAERGAGGAYLAGPRFSLADLGAASTLAMLVRPPASPVSAPEPVAPAFRALMQRFAGHPGAAWVRDIYARHRGARTDFDGPSPRAAA